MALVTESVFVALRFQASSKTPCMSIVSRSTLHSSAGGLRA